MSYEPEIEDILKDLEKFGKRKKNSCRKGKNAERSVCKILEKRFNLSFSRSPESGGMATRGVLSEIVSGDIIVPDNFKFTIESKCGYDIDLINLFKENSSDKKLFNKFLDQVLRDSEIANKLPLLIYKKDNRTPLAVLYYDLVKKSFPCMIYVYKNIFWDIISIDTLLSESDDFFLN